MTFKHNDFSSSETMRSLEKIAKAKGWVSNDTPSAKIASMDNSDLSTSSNITENIIKLCVGLRKSGFESYANEIETNFLNYKKAQTLYETSKETGEDLVDRAHPKGSHKLSDMTGDNVIETIVDQHLKNLKVIDKKPNGKLSSSKEILNAVKIVLAKDDAKSSHIKQYLNLVLNNIKTIDNLHSEDSWLWSPVTLGVSEIVTNLNNAISKADDPILSQLLPKIKLEINDYYYKLESHFIGGSSDSTWNIMKPLFLKIFGALNEIERLSTIVEEKKPVANQASTLDKWISMANSTLASFSAKIKTDPELNNSDKKNALNWIAQTQAHINDIASSWENFTSEEERNQNAPFLLSNLKKITTPSFAEFKRNFID